MLSEIEQINTCKIDSDTALGTPCPIKPSPTPSRTPKPTVTPSRTSKPTPTPTRTATATVTPSKSEKPTPTPSKTAKVTPTPSRTAKATPTPSKSQKPTPTPTATNTATPTQTATPTITPSETPPQSPTATNTPTPTPSTSLCYGVSCEPGYEVDLASCECAPLEVLEPPIPYDPPDIPCSPGVIDDDGNTINTLRVNGYAYYVNNINSTKTITGPGAEDSVTIKTSCAGGHRCNRTEFDVKLTFSDNAGNVLQEYVGDHSINLNNSIDGADKESAFSFGDIPVELFAENPFVSLQCLLPICHTGVVWVVLVTTFNKKTKLLFSKCVVPNPVNAVAVDYGCYDDAVVQSLPYTP